MLFLRADQATAFLEDRGFHLRRDGTWDTPHPTYLCSALENDAVASLIKLAGHKGIRRSRPRTSRRLLFWNFVWTWGPPIGIVVAVALMAKAYLW